MGPCVTGQTRHRSTGVDLSIITARRYASAVYAWHDDSVGLSQAHIPSKPLNVSSGNQSRRRPRDYFSDLNDLGEINSNYNGVPPNRASNTQG